MTGKYRLGNKVWKLLNWVEKEDRERQAKGRRKEQESRILDENRDEKNELCQENIDVERDRTKVADK